MNNNQDVSKNNNSIKSLLLLSATIRLIAVFGTVTCLWLVLNKLL
jgi:hypothetical protein